MVFPCGRFRRRYTPIITYKKYIKSDIYGAFIDGFENLAVAAATESGRLATNAAWSFAGRRLP
jgi:hypothetical protein